MESNTKVYLATPDNQLARFIRSELQGRGYRIQEAMDWSFVAEEVGLFGADIVLLASDLPEADPGLIIEQMKLDPRNSGRSLIVLLPEWDEKAVGFFLERGADDYLCGPPDVNELVTRVQLHARRTPAPGEVVDINQSVVEDGPIAVGDGDDENAGPRFRGVVPDGMPSGFGGWYEPDMCVLIEVSEALASSLSTPDALFVLTRRLAQAIPVFRCNILVRGVQPGEAFVVASHDNADIRRRAVDLSRYPEVKKCMQDREMVLVEDVRKDPMYEGVFDFITSVDLRSAMVVPLFVREVVVGTLALTTRREVHGFSKRELMFVRAMANLAAGLLSVSDLVATVRREAATEKPPAEEFDEVVLGIEDQIEGLIEQLEKK
jgi:CheY-like chemotaxis protein